MSNAAETESTDVGWLRALASSAAILVVGIGVLVYGVNATLTRLTSLSRHGRVAVATTLFSVAFVALAWLLRYLQRRRMI